MEIKGTAVKSTQEYVKKNYPDRYKEWLSSLPEISQDIYNDVILSGNWYSLIDSVLIPTEKIGELFFDGDIKKAAYQAGKDSALQALSGIYKIFVRIATVDFVLKRVKSIFSTYYATGKFELKNRSPKRDVFVVTGFKKEEKLILERVSGWIEGVYQVISQNPKKVGYEYKDIGNGFIDAEIIIDL
jgi:hypothetical protein